MQEMRLVRRRFLGYFSSVGLGSTLLPGTLWARWQETQASRITRAMLAEAEKLAGLEFTDEERELMLEDVNSTLESFESLRTFPLDNGIAPAIHFDPVLPHMQFPNERRPMRRSPVPPLERPADLEKAAFWPVTHLAELIRSRQVSSVELTEMYLARLAQHSGQLECLVTLTGDLALRQARRADEETGRGGYRGPLHGIPWGAKDLLAARGYPTTWGAAPFKDQTLDLDATVVSRLEQAGAVLIGKLTMGALAWGDVWFGGRTRNPWNLEQGSSGSSAGSAAATAAGLVGFSIGTETLGSIISPSTRCGVTGLRPTYGRVSRYGAMALSWSMDKIGPICRGVEDCALVLDAIHGPDRKDETVRDLPFNWEATADPRKLRVGYLKSAFDRERASAEVRAAEQAVLNTLEGLGIELAEFELPDGLPLDALDPILNVEAAAAFDELTRSGRDDLMVRQIRNAWPNVFRHSRFVPAVEYLQANRIRRVLMGAMDAAMADVDVYLAPSGGSSNSLITNLTGHPAAVVPIGFNEQGSPLSMTFNGHLFGEAEVLLVALAYQQATDFHRRQPPQFAV